MAGIEVKDQRRDTKMDGNEGKEDGGDLSSLKAPEGFDREQLQRDLNDQKTADEAKEGAKTSMLEDDVAQEVPKIDDSGDDSQESLSDVSGPTIDRAAEQKNQQPNG